MFQHNNECPFAQSEIHEDVVGQGRSGSVLQNVRCQEKAFCLAVHVVSTAYQPILKPDKHKIKIKLLYCSSFITLNLMCHAFNSLKQTFLHLSD